MLEGLCSTLPVPWEAPWAESLAALSLTDGGRTPSSSPHPSLLGAASKGINSLRFRLHQGQEARSRTQNGVLRPLEAVCCLWKVSRPTENCLQQRALNEIRGG